MAELDRPIFVVGHARGGSTALGAILNWHSHVGPKYDPIPRCESIGALLAAILDNDAHGGYSSQLEQKDAWFDAFPGGREVFTHMGRELTADEPPTPERRAHLIARLTAELRQPRYLSKAPTNSFRVRALRAMFPDAKIVAIYRRGEQVIASWGRRHYGFNKPVDWGTTKIDRLSYPAGIDLFARKWRETIEQIEAHRRELDILTITYDALVEDPAPTLAKVFEHLELPFEDYAREVKLTDRADAWKATIPPRHRLRLWRRTRAGNAIIRRTRRALAA